MHLDKLAIALFLNKDEAASAYIFSKTSRLVKHIAYQVLHDEADAEDVMMEVYLSLFGLRVRFPNQNAFLSYLCRAAKNAAVNLAKKKGRVDLSEDEESFASEEEKNPSPLLHDAERLLGKEDYELVTLHLCLDLPFPVIASIQGGTASSCRGRYFRALRKLRKNLREEDYR